MIAKQWIVATLAGSAIPAIAALPSMHSGGELGTSWIFLLPIAQTLLVSISQAFVLHKHFSSVLVWIPITTLGSLAAELFSMISIGAGPGPSDLSTGIIFTIVGGLAAFFYSAILLGLPQRRFFRRRSWNVEGWVVATGSGSAVASISLLGMGILALNAELAWLPTAGSSNEAFVMVFAQVWYWVPIAVFQALVLHRLPPRPPISRA
ncbi:MAG: hypothetical protein IID54_05730 [Proteobacteria bacterium]|nr:hypothetical protein [Pseudomonadota bacterium]